MEAFFVVLALAPMIYGHSHEQTMRGVFFSFVCLVLLSGLALFAFARGDPRLFLLLAISGVALPSVAVGVMMAIGKPKRRKRRRKDKPLKTRPTSTMACWQCAETIKKEALKCRFCGADPNRRILKGKKV